MRSSVGFKISLYFILLGYHPNTLSVAVNRDDVDWTYPAQLPISKFGRPEQQTAHSPIYRRHLSSHPLLRNDDDVGVSLVIQKHQMISREENLINEYVLVHDSSVNGVMISASLSHSRKV